MYVSISSDSYAFILISIWSSPSSTGTACIWTIISSTCANVIVINYTICSAITTCVIAIFSSFTWSFQTISSDYFSGIISRVRGFRSYTNFTSICCCVRSTRASRITFYFSVNISTIVIITIPIISSFSISPYSITSPCFSTIFCSVWGSSSCTLSSNISRCSWNSVIKKFYFTI